MPDPEKASIVDVQFTDAEESTIVTVTHHSWERHGPNAKDYRNDFVQAWPLALDRFDQHMAK